MKHFFQILVLAATITSASACAAPRAPGMTVSVDLASDTAWTLHCDDGPARPIKVTGGGWNSDQQSPQIPSAAAIDHVVYERQIVIPAEAEGRTVKIEFGGCNYGAEVWLNDTKITDHIGPMTPFEADLTAVAKPGATCRLRVKAYTRMHYGNPPSVPVPFDFNQDIPGVPSQYNGHTKFAYGLIGYVRLVLSPPVYVADVFVQPSVTKKQLACDVWIANSSRIDRRVELAGMFSPGNDKRWSYPIVPRREVTVPAGQTIKVTLAGIPWTLGPDSYWWPNIPFREGYVATLHWMNLSLREAGELIAERRQRFGFVEHAEGPYFYMVNGVRYTSFSDSNSDGQVGEYDCWTETPCFQPKGCADTWKRYQRIGFNSMRLSTSVPTEAMLATADEAGYMLIPEGGSWGNGTSRFHRENFSRQLQAMIRTCRSHPCVARYSLANESLPGAFASADNPWRWLIDAAREADATRPYVFEVNNGQTGAVPGMHTGHANQMEHYQPIVKCGDHLRGMGECDWGTDNLGDFSVNARKYRLNDWAHFAPWSFVNFWPNFLEGMSHARHPWKFNNHPDRTDGVDGWGSPIITLLQRSLHPYLVQDLDILTENPGAPRQPGGGKIQWPYQLPVAVAGMKVERRVEIFNGGLSGNKLSLAWTAHWDRPDGPVAVGGGEIPCEIEPGFHAAATVAFTIPAPGQQERRLYLVMESRIHGQTVFREDGVYLNVRGN